MDDPTSIIVIGASAGGVSALLSLTAGLLKPLPVPVLIVLHIGAQPSELWSLMNSAGVTPAKQGENGETVRPGVFYLAPPDRHMLVAEGRICLTRGPKENFARPAIDPLFRSAAEAYGPAALGVILTGKLNDGTAGLYEIKRRGGVTVVQDPDDAACADMPKSAALHVEVDYCLPLAEIPSLITKLAVENARVASLKLLQRPPEKGRDMIDGEALDRPLTVTCPDCGGALRRTDLGTLIKYDCHIGHAYTAEALAEAQFDQMERLMRAAERILNERAEFCCHMAERAEALSLVEDGVMWRSARKEAQDRAYKMRDLVEQDWINPPGVSPIGSCP
jgi:two-component system chemotaxis response regulator CheB